MVTDGFYSWGKDGVEGFDSFVSAFPARRRKNRPARQVAHDATILIVISRHVIRQDIYIFLILNLLYFTFL